MVPEFRKAQVLTGTCTICAVSPFLSCLSCPRFPLWYSPAVSSHCLLHVKQALRAGCPEVFRDIYDLASDKPDHPLKNGLDFQFPYAIIDLVNEGTWVCAGLSGKGKLHNLGGISACASCRNWILECLHHWIHWPLHLVSCPFVVWDVALLKTVSSLNFGNSALTLSL